MTEAVLRAFRRQFVWGPEVWRVGPAWRSLALADGVWLSHDEDLPITFARRPTGGAGVLLGHAVDARVGHPVGVDELAELTLDNYAERTAAWAGRWVLVLDGWIVTDIGGLLGVFYPTERSARSWGSSSGVLLNRKLGVDERRRPLSIAPTSPYAGLRLLLPGEALELATGEVRLVDRRPFRRVAGSEEHLVEQGLQLIAGALRGYAELSRGKGLAIGLSGGADSRRNAAVAVHAGVPAELYSFRKSWFATSTADLRLPPRVGAMLGLPFRHVGPGRWASERHALWLEHTADAAADRRPGSNYFYFTRGFWAALGYGRITVEGQAYELGSNYYYPAHWGIGPDFTHVEAAGCGTSFTADELALADAFWAQLEPGVEIDRRDLLFWTYTTGTAYSRLYYESDLWTDALTPANCRLLHSVMLSVPPARREGKAFQNRITALAAPVLATLPINPPDSFLRHQYQRWLNLRRLAARDGGGAALRKLGRFLTGRRG